MASVRSTLEAEVKLSASDGALTTIASDGAELVRKVERKLFESSPVFRAAGAPRLGVALAFDSIFALNIKVALLSPLPCLPPLSNYKQRRK